MNYSLSTIVIALSTLIALSLPARASDEIILSTQQKQALGIKTEPLPSARAGEVSGLPAQVVIPSNQMFVVSTPLPAMIEQTLVGVGDHVNQGQPIARLQSPALAEAQRGLLQTTVQNRLAQENLKRDEELWKDGIISESRYRAAKGTALEAQASLSERLQVLRLAGMSDAAIEKLQSGGDLTSLLTMTAPINGVVLERSASAGQRLDAAVPIFTIARLHPLALEIQAPLAYTRDLKKGAKVTVPAFSASGQLSAIGHSLTGANQTILLRATLQKGTENLRPGQYVEASIATSTGNRKQWVVPNSAISRVRSKAIIFIETPKGFRAQDVTVLNEGAQDSVITGPLKGNESVAVSGVSALKSNIMGIGGGE